MNETKYIQLKEEIADILHEFHRECLEEPLNNLPLTRQRRKKDYADKIIDAVLLAEHTD